MTTTCSDAEELALLLDDVRRAEHHLARAVVRAGRLASSGVSERVEGLPLDLLLGVACRLTGADRRMLIAAGETLADLPAVSTLFTGHGLSWGQVRAITTAAKRLSADARAVLDARVAARLTAHPARRRGPPATACSRVGGDRHTVAGVSRRHLLAGGGSGRSARR